MATFTIDSLSALDNIAACLAHRIVNFGLPALFLRGPLGSGKTTFVSKIVSHLPGGAFCEAASPSFNICNFYRTVPPVIHCDLFRCRSAIPEELAQALDDGEHLVMIEWAEYLPGNLLPSNYLDFYFKLEYNQRLLEVIPSTIKLHNLWAGCSTI